MPKVKGILLEAKFTDEYVTRGNIYEVVEVEIHEGYKVFWFVADDGQLDYAYYNGRSNLFDVYYQI